MRNKHALFPFTMGFLALICFFVVVLLMASAVQPPWSRIMILLLPALILCVVGFLALNGKLASKKTIVLTVVLSVIFLIASIFYTVLLSIWTATTVTTDVKYYSMAYAQNDDEDGVKGIFPATIPSDAKDIAFSYTPQFLQGGEVFELSYIVTDEALSEWKTQLEKAAEWIGSNEEWHRTNNWSFHDADSTRYHLYWDGGSNHGEMSYALVEPSTNRITFYYTDW